MFLIRYVDQRKKHKYFDQHQRKTQDFLIDLKITEETSEKSSGLVSEHSELKSTD